MYSYDPRHPAQTKAVTAYIVNKVSSKLTAALLEGVAGVIRLAAADEAADRVAALGVLAAGVSLAFVHVC